jgi:hypothetical protein
MIFMPRKVVEIDDFEEEFEEDEEEFEEDTFTCRICRKECEFGEGDDLILVCDECAPDYDFDKLWDAYEEGEIGDDELPIIDLDPYLIKKKK